MTAKDKHNKKELKWKFESEKSLTRFLQDGKLTEFKETLTAINRKRIDIYKIPWYRKGVNIGFTRAIVEIGFDLSHLLNDQTFTALHLAAREGYLELVKYLVEEVGVNINTFTKDGDTVLHCLVKVKNTTSAHEECLEYLLALDNLDINTTNKKGYTPFHKTIKKNQKGLFNKFLLHKEKLMLDSTMAMGKIPRKCLNDWYPARDNALIGVPPRELSTAEKNFFWLLDAKNEDRFCEELNELEISERRELTRLEENGWTLLQKACYNGASRAVEALLNLGAEVNVSTKSAQPPIYLACMGGHVPILEKLLIRPNIQFTHYDRKMNVLHILVQSRDESESYRNFMTRQLQIHEKEVNEPDSLGRTPLHYATLHENEKRVLELLDHGAYLDVKDIRKQKPIDIINFDTLKTFLDSKVKTNNKKFHDEDFQIWLDYSQILRPMKNGYIFPTKLLYSIKSKEHLQTLIMHPILSYIIFIKWRLLSFFVYINAITYIVFTAFFTTYLLLGADDQGDGGPARFFHYASLFILGILILTELFHVISYPKVIMNSLDSQVRFFVILLCCLTLALDCSYLTTVKKTRPCKSLMGCSRFHICPHLSALAILLSWFEFFFIIGKIPEMTFFVNIFRRAFLLLIKFVFVHIPITVGFALSFTVMFSRHNPPEGEENPFATSWESIFKTFIMLTGEFDSSSIPFEILPITSHIIFISFICTIAIVLFNLLIGLATSSTQDIEDHPFMYSCRSQIYLIRRFERILFTRKSMTQKILHSIFWSKLCQAIFRYRYGRTQPVKKRAFGPNTDMSDFIVKCKPNDKYRVSNYFLFSFDSKDNGHLYVHQKSKIGNEHGRKKILPPEILKRAKEIIRERNKKKVDSMTEESLLTIAQQFKESKTMMENVQRRLNKIEPLLESMQVALQGDLM